MLWALNHLFIYKVKVITPSPRINYGNVYENGQHSI